MESETGKFSEILIEYIFMKYINANIDISNVKTQAIVVKGVN